ncbi:PREDICTED: protein SMAX1-LIKE 3-like isoform X2 [Tarenaya hassleriana]|nr:PREDICTED: protein SMAX1-LIKE 3-like isoform X2 [Tarenaya hassleriana]XP_010553591.1 PREDICTED: protein SMAX1-LIKE 3-like isoform X2 [Tarenaya hassleriana]
MALARCRGHAQVTPLHVANTMLSSSTGLLRTACLQPHTHPLQSRALQLCFNVALNRLPTSPSASPMLGAPISSSYPSISNALVAVFKRAQAHQRRGSIESQQQQPILAVKIELEQLIISILDDPSVSRVMREAGFSSTHVKSKVEQAVSLETTSSVKPKEGTDNNAVPLSQAGANKLSTPIRNEDVMYVVENLVDKRRRNFVIVGECLTTIDRVVRALVEKIDRRDVPEVLKGVKFITLSFSSSGQPSRAEVEQKLEELEMLVRSYGGKGLILNLGDLNWIVEYRARSSSYRLGRGYDHCPAEHMIMEIGKLGRGLMMGDNNNNNGRFRIMGMATTETYVRCKLGHPSLESLWSLTTITIPASSLRLSLVSHSEVENESVRIKTTEREDERLQCSGGGDARTAPLLPAWLQQYKNETEQSHHHDHDTDPDSIKELRVKWNSVCKSIHKKSGNSLTLSSVSRSSSFSHELTNLHRSNSDWLSIESNRYCQVPTEPNFRVLIPESDNDHVKGELFPTNPNSAVNSAGSSSDAMEMEYVSKLKEVNSENVRVLCDALEKKVPWQKDIVPEIARTVLKCRSGSTNRKQLSDKNDDVKEETWLIFEGGDVKAKEKIARELAKLVFGSQNRFVSICLSSLSSTRADSTKAYLRNKRTRDERSWSHIETLSEAVSNDPHRVFFLEDIDQTDHFSQMGFKRAIERGRVQNASGEEASLGDSVVILSCESFRSRTRTSSPRKSDGSDHSEDKNVTTASPCVSFDLNLSLEDDVSKEQPIDDIGLLEAVDGMFHFRNHHHHHNDHHGDA